MRHFIATILLFLASTAPARSDDPAPDSLSATAEWIALSPDSSALWVEGVAPDGHITLELKVADDTTVIAARETIASESHFSSLLRPTRLPHASYTVEITSGRDVLRIPVTHGTEEQRARYAALELAWFGEAFEQALSLTRELNRVHEDHLQKRDRETWDAWSREWKRRHDEMKKSLEKFRLARVVLARAPDYYQLVSSLCFAKTLHELYAAELGYREGELGGGETAEWAVALDEQFEVFQERRQPPSPADFDRWVKELGSEDCGVRERATRGLARAGEAARAAMEAESANPDPEVAARLAELIRRLETAK
ncbi:MAG: hypothetical protein HYY18_03870 [Planctomycetes bacterium]|nr:hypothetical protein [Planctomycetota bacterium]